VKNSLKRKIEIRSERGQSLTEFALALPLLILLLFAVIQFGIIFNNYVTLTDAARAGARKGAVGRQLPDPRGAVVKAVKDSASDLDPASLGITVNGDFSAGSDVTVTATYPYTIKLIGLPVKSGQLSSTTTERVE